jgi:exodeoxyribonuclease VII small subunit
MSKPDRPKTQPDIFASPSNLPPPSEGAHSGDAMLPRPQGAAKGASTAQSGADAPDAAQPDHGGQDKAGGNTLPSSFENALTELEAVVGRMESGELTLEESLSAYQRGATLLQYCQGKLNDAQQQVKILEAGVLKEFSGTADNGQ